jgi:hypothetical protein
VAELKPAKEDDLECVAVFDGDKWTLQLVSSHIRAK